MDCEEMLHLIGNYLDGSLPHWRAVAAARHMGECPPCADHSRFHVHYREVVASKCHEEAPLTLRLRVSEAIGSLQFDQRPLEPGRNPLDPGGRRH